MPYTDTELQNLSRSKDKLVRTIAARYYVERGDLRTKLAEVEKERDDFHKTCGELLHASIEGDGSVTWSKMKCEKCVEAEKKRDEWKCCADSAEKQRAELKSGYDKVEKRVKAAEAIIPLFDVDHHRTPKGNRLDGHEHCVACGWIEKFYTLAYSFNEDTGYFFDGKQMRLVQDNLRGLGDDAAPQYPLKPPEEKG